MFFFSKEGGLLCFQIFDISQKYLKNVHFFMKKFIFYDLLHDSKSSVGIALALTVKKLQLF